MTAADLSQRIEQARAAQGMTTRDLARSLGVKAATVENWESGRSEPRANTLASMAGLLNVPVAWLLEGGDHADEGRVPENGAAQVARKLERAQVLQRSLAALLVEISDDVARLSRG